MDEKKLIINFNEYISHGEPAQKEKAGYWQIAIGLQEVVGLRVSDFLQETACQHIEDRIKIDEVRNLVNQHYISSSVYNTKETSQKEADLVASNIVKLLSSSTFELSAYGYASLHRSMYEGVKKHAGEYRTHNNKNKEWVLEGDVIDYVNIYDLSQILENHLKQEKAYSYQGKSQDEIISHLTGFVSRLWQINAFGGGNTHTTAVFTILYLRSLGLEIDNSQFEKNSLYFRNALVRANYQNKAKGIDYTPIYLERFFRNLLLGEQWDLRNRYLQINPTKEWKEQPNLAPQKSSANIQLIPIKQPQESPNKQLEDSSNTLPNKSPNKLPNKQPNKTPNKLPNKLPNKFQTKNLYIKKLVSVIGIEEMSIKEMLELAGLKDRVNFINLYINPAIKGKYVRLLFPHTPRHPRQKYLLTPKGLALYNDINGIIEAEGNDELQ